MLGESRKIRSQSLLLDILVSADMPTFCAGVAEGGFLSCDIGQVRFTQRFGEIPGCGIFDALLERCDEHQHAVTKCQLDGVGTCFHICLYPAENSPH